LLLRQRCYSRLILTDSIHTIHLGDGTREIAGDIAYIEKFMVFGIAFLSTGEGGFAGEGLVIGAHILSGNVAEV